MRAPIARSAPRSRANRVAVSARRDDPQVSAEHAFLTVGTRSRDRETIAVTTRVSFAAFWREPRTRRTGRTKAIVDAAKSARDHGPLTVVLAHIVRK
jgi:hypothetical protein